MDNVSVSKEFLSSMIKVLEDIQNPKVEWNEDPLKMAHDAIKHMKGRLVVMTGKIKGLVDNT